MNCISNVECVVTVKTRIEMTTNAWMESNLQQFCLVLYVGYTHTVKHCQSVFLSFVDRFAATCQQTKQDCMFVSIDSRMFIHLTGKQFVLNWNIFRIELNLKLIANEIFTFFFLAVFSRYVNFNTSLHSLLFQTHFIAVALIKPTTLRYYGITHKCLQKAR